MISLVTPLPSMTEQRERALFFSSRSLAEGDVGSGALVIIGHLVPAYHCKLVYFHSAMVSRGASKAICGSLACITPETALGCVGRLADA